MSWTKVQATVVIEGYHLDLGSDHHRTLQSIILKIFECATVCLRGAYIVEHYHETLELQEFKEYTLKVYEKVKSMKEPISKLQSFAANECNYISHEMVKIECTKMVEEMKNLINNFDSISEGLTVKLITTYLQNIFKFFSDIMKFIQKDVNLTMKDNCEVILKNSSKLQKLLNAFDQNKQDEFRKYSKLLACQLVNGIGLPLREKGSVCDQIADKVDELVIQLCTNPTQEVVNEVNEVVKRSKEVFGKVKKATVITIDTNENEDKDKSFYFMPMFTVEELKEYVMKEKEDSASMKMFVEDNYKETLTMLIKSVKGMAEITIPNIPSRLSDAKLNEIIHNVDNTNTNIVRIDELFDIVLSQIRQDVSTSEAARSSTSDSRSNNDILNILMSFV